MPGFTPSDATSAPPLPRIVLAIRVKSPFSHSALFGFIATPDSRGGDATKEKRGGQIRAAAAWPFALAFLAECSRRPSRSRDSPLRGDDMNLIRTAVAGALLAALAHEALADNTYILATGRRDPRMYAIDLKAALSRRTRTRRTRSSAARRPALDRLDGRRSAIPATSSSAKDRKTAYVVNHHGRDRQRRVPAARRARNIAVMDIGKMVKKKHDDTADALERHIDAGWFGALGLVLLKDTFRDRQPPRAISPRTAATASPFVDRRPAACAAWSSCAGRPNAAARCSGAAGLAERPPTFAHRSARTALLAGAAALAASAGAAFPDTNGIALGARQRRQALPLHRERRDRRRLGDRPRARAGRQQDRRDLRIPEQIGPVRASRQPDGRWVVSANRESQKMAFEGNTISFIDVELARAGRLRCRGRARARRHQRPERADAAVHAVVHARRARRSCAELPAEQRLDRRPRRRATEVAWRIPLVRPADPTASCDRRGRKARRSPPTAATP
jgi:hypothetical protein